MTQDQPHDVSPVLADVPEDWPVASSTYLHRDHWVVALRADTISAPSGDPDARFRRLVLEHPGAAVILAIDEQERVFCLWQYRHPARHRFLELPAGLCDGDADEEPVEVARRELREEAQLQAETWTLLTSTYSSPGISAELMHIFLARDLSTADRGDFELHAEEADMTTAWVPFADLHGAVLAGQLRDSPVQLAVLLARARGLA